MKYRPTALCTLFLLASVGCGDADIGAEESYMSESAAPIPGAQISSPSVDPNKWYWGARRIDELEDVGYFDDVDAQVARRADGIIAHLQPNGAIGALELAKLETDHFDTLFPEEQAAIANLWAILELDDAPEFSPSDTVTVAIEDDFTATPFDLPINQLTEEALRTTAQRIELTHDSDGDSATISGTDVANAYANRGAYLPVEVQHFKNINGQIAAAAPRPDGTTQRMVVTSNPGTPVLDVPSVKIGCSTSVNHGTWSDRSPSNWPRLFFQYELSTADTASNVTVISLDKKTGQSSYLVAGQKLRKDATHRVEVWQNGSRIEQYDVVAPPVEEYSDRIPFAYDLFIDQAHLVMGFERYNRYPSDIRGTYDADAQSAPVRLPAGSYRVFGPTDMRVDIFETGRIHVVDQGLSQACTPTGISQTRITRCSTSDGTASIDFTDRMANDSPDFGIVRMGNEIFPLYPL